MNNDQYIIVRVTPDGKAYTWWVADIARDTGLPNEPVRATANRSAVAATVASAIQTEIGGASLAT